MRHIIFQRWHVTISLSSTSLSLPPHSPWHLVKARTLLLSASTCTCVRACVCVWLSFYTLLQLATTIRDCEKETNGFVFACFSACFLNHFYCFLFRNHFVISVSLVVLCLLNSVQLLKYSSYTVALYVYICICVYVCLCEFLSVCV